MATYEKNIQWKNAYENKYIHSFGYSDANLTTSYPKLILDLQIYFKVNIKCGLDSCHILLAITRTIHF